MDTLSVAKPPPVQMHRAVDVYRGNVAKYTFYQWVKEGRVRLFRVGGSSYVAEDFATLIRRIADEDQAKTASRGRAGREAARKAYEARRGATVA